MTKSQLLKQQQFLRERLDQLQESTGIGGGSAGGSSVASLGSFMPSIHKRRSISECSSGVSSTSSNSEPDTSDPNDMYDNPINGKGTDSSLYTILLTSLFSLPSAGKILHSFAHIKMDQKWAMTEQEKIPAGFMQH